MGFFINVNSGVQDVTYKLLGSKGSILITRDVQGVTPNNIDKLD